MDALAPRRLTPARRALLELMQRTQFGRIEGLQICNGDPVLSPAPLVVRHIKFGVAPRTYGLEQGALKAQVIDLFCQLDQLADGTIASLEIQDGLPFRMTIQEPGT